MSIRLASYSLASLTTVVSVGSTNATKASGMFKTRWMTTASCRFTSRKLVLINNASRQGKLRQVSSNSRSSSSPNTTTTTTSTATESSTSLGDKGTGSSAAVSEEQRLQYLRDANRQMQKYHETRELMKKGKLVPKNPEYYKNRSQSHNVQIGAVVLVLVGFLVSPLVGKKIARDEEFRNRWIPSWYDFTLRKPEKPWTRQELHEQMLAVQRDLHERAIAGDFAPEKLQDLQKNLQDLEDSFHPHRKGIDRSKIPKNWDKIHPGLDNDEKVHEED